LALFSIISHATATLEKVSLQLDWKYQFEFSGFIIAKEKASMKMRFYVQKQNNITVTMSL
jgi:hypothetical protein